MISSRIRQLVPFYAMEILEKAIELERAGKNIIHLEIGEPDFDTPEVIKNSAKLELDYGNTNYTHSLGFYELREEISKFYYNRYNVKISPERILVTNGTSPGLFLAFSAILEAGDNVILTNPCYPCYSNIIKFLGGKIQYININEEDNFQINIEEVKRHINKSKAILINSPSNPTGTLLTKEVLKELAELGIMIISDEIYHGLVFEGKEHSSLEFTDNAIVLNGFSKLFAMTGWRLGYLIVPENLIRPLQIMHQNFFISANSFVQKAGITALREAEKDVKKMIDIYNKRRIFMIKRLKEMGFDLKNYPTGAFYVFLNVKKFTNNSLKFALEILEKAGVGVTPGIDFGSNGEGFIRLCYANSLENIEEALNRLEMFFKNY